ncbi:MAG: elongation factor Ts [Endomicrobium sp.]|jgi:elongation factor Ts|nr:elongation factor Ts [Endomicrobium sp.]
MSTELVSKLRKMTGAGVMNCKNALKESNDDIDKACRWLRERKMTLAVEKICRSTKQGIVYSYIHNNETLGVLVEINCETDFVAKTEEFKNLAREIAMQIAATAPIYISRDSIPLNVIESEKDIYKTQLLKEKKSEDVFCRIIDGKLEKFYSNVCLYDQIYIRDTVPKKTIKDLVTDVIMKTGENIIIRRFARFKVGEY